MIAKVIVNNPNSNVDIEYSYNIPLEMEKTIKVGVRVKVMFGQSNRLLMGYVTSITNEVTDFVLKDIFELVDLEPIISTNQLLLAEFIRNDTISPFIRVLNQMIPSALLLKTKKYLNLLDQDNIDADILTLFGGRKVIEYTTKMNCYNYKIQKACELGYLEISYEADQKAKEKLQTQYYYNELPSDLKPVIKTKLSLLSSLKNYTKQEITDITGLTVYMVDKLIKSSILLPHKSAISRIKVRDIPINKSFDASIEEIDEIITLLEKTNQTTLVIPSLINEQNIIIQKIIRRNISNQKNTLVITPDILSSYRLASIIRKALGISVACLNSELSDGELLDYYKEIKENNYSVYVSTPKCSLYEYPNLATIIMIDTESDNYYNDQSPRYNLKVVMDEYAKIYNAKLIMMSFSPSLTDYVESLSGKHELIELKEKEQDSEIEVIDLKEELLKANSSPLSNRLKAKIKAVIQKNKQVLLITNRKLYSNYVMCRACGEIEKCKRCDVPLAFSAKQNLLICPACGTRYQMSNVCPNCEGNIFRFEGSGMEQILEELNNLFPNIRTCTIDEANYQNIAYNNTLIEENNVDIIVATSVFSRSIVNDNLGLVAIINLDEVMGNQSYIANERAFTVLTQAKQLLTNQAELIIQTFHPDSFVIKSFISSMYKEFIKEELSNRKILKNEPFYNINRIFVKGAYDLVFKEANNVKKLLQEMLGKKVFIIGPTYNKMHQAVQIIVKHQEKNISDAYLKIYRLYQNSQVSLIFDKYPRYI